MSISIKVNNQAGIASGGRSYRSGISVRILIRVVLFNLQLFR